MIGIRRSQKKKEGRGERSFSITDAGRPITPSDSSRKKKFGTREVRERQSRESR